MKKNKFLAILLLSTFCIFIASQSGIAAEKTVELTVPGCAWMTTFLMVSSILEGINGVLEYAVDPANHTATVTFDNKKTTVDKIEKALSDGEFPVEGDPRFLK